MILKDCTVRPETKFNLMILQHPNSDIHRLYVAKVLGCKSLIRLELTVKRTTIVLVA